MAFKKQLPIAVLNRKRTLIVNQPFLKNSLGLRKYKALTV